MNLELDRHEDGEWSLHAPGGTPVLLIGKGDGPTAHDYAIAEARLDAFQQREAVQEVAAVPIATDWENGDDGYG